MQITELTLTSFRKFPSLHITFDPKEHIHCFIGPNTIGKTNIIEALYFLSVVTSFRTHDMKSLCRWEEDFFSLHATYMKKGSATEAQINIVLRPKKQKKLRIDGEEVAYSTYMGKFPIIFFSPDDITDIMHSPSNRRKYLDILLSQTDKEYLPLLVQYQRTLSQRNALLRSIRAHRASPSELDVWDDVLASTGHKIAQKRIALLEYCNTHISTPYQEIAMETASCSLAYSIPHVDERLKSPESYLAILQSHRDKDIQRETTTWGPHRDNFLLLKNGIDIEEFASRGDIRSFVLALKIVELQYIEEKTGETPLLLLDDVFSELDNHRQEYLLSHIPAHVQTFITTTSEHIGVLDQRKKDIHFYYVDTMLAK